MARGKSDRKGSVKIIVACIAVILCYAFAFALLSYTIVKPVLVVSISLGISMVTAMPFVLKWVNVNSRKTVIIRTLYYILVMTGFVMSLLLGINYFIRDTAASYNYDAKIERIFAETAYRKRRVGNRHYVNGEPYKEFYMLVVLPDGKCRKFPVSTDFYNRYAAVSHIPARRPKIITLTVTPGAFGWPIVRLPSKY